VEDDAGLHGRPPDQVLLVDAVAQLDHGVQARRRAPDLKTGDMVVTTIGFVAWYSGVARLGVERAGLFAGLIPVAALASVAVVGASEISGTKLAGSLVVGAGIVLGLGGPGRPRPASPRPSG
jgi:hypothetical protein